MIFKVASFVEQASFKPSQQAQLLTSDSIVIQLATLEKMEKNELYAEKFAQLSQPGSLAALEHVEKLIKLDAELFFAAKNREISDEKTYLAVLKYGPADQVRGRQDLYPR